MAVEELFQWGELFKFPVRPLQDGFVGIIQPVTLTFGYGIQSLRIELAVVDADIRIDGTGDLNADETAAATDRAPSTAEWSKIHRMTEYCTKFTHADHVPDPYYGGSEGFEYVLDILEDACAGLLQSI